MAALCGLSRKEKRMEERAVDGGEKRAFEGRDERRSSQWGIGRETSFLFDCLLLRRDYFGGGNLIQQKRRKVAMIPLTKTGQRKGQKQAITYLFFFIL